MGPPILGIIKYSYNDPFMGWRDEFFFFYKSQAETGEIKVGTHSLRQGYWPRLIILKMRGVWIWNFKKKKKKSSHRVPTGFQ